MRHWHSFYRWIVALFCLSASLTAADLPTQTLTVSSWKIVVNGTITRSSATSFQLYLETVGVVLTSTGVVDPSSNVNSWYNVSNVQLRRPGWAAESAGLVGSSSSGWVAGGPGWVKTGNTISMVGKPAGTYEIVSFNSSPTMVLYTFTWNGTEVSIPEPTSFTWNIRVISETRATTTLTLRANSAVIGTFGVPGLSDSITSGSHWTGSATVVNGQSITVSAPAGYSIAQGPAVFLPHTVHTPPNPDSIGGDMFLVVYKTSVERRQVTVRLVVKDSRGIAGDNVIAQMSNDESLANEIMRVPTIANAMNSKVWIGEVEDGVSFDLAVPAGGVVLIDDSAPVSATKTNFYYLVEFPPAPGGTPTPGTAVAWDKDGDGAPDSLQYTDPDGNSGFINTPDLNSPVVTRPGSGTGTPNTGSVISGSIGNGTDNQLLKAILNEVAGFRKDVADRELPFEEAPTNEALANEDVPMMDTTAFTAKIGQLNPFDKFTIGTTEPVILDYKFDLPLYGEIDLSYNFGDEPVATWVSMFRAFALLLLTFGAALATIRLFSKGLSSI